MATSLMNPVIHQLRRAMLLPDGAGLTDGQLLESFVSQKDEAAFEVLVRRHGPMVLGVCRRVLGNHHDAEDAFQATFLVLVRKANSIMPREMIANWLYGVANRTALKGRSMIAKQRVRERQVTAMPELEVAEPDDCWRQLQPLLDQELSRLPDKFRVPIVLCDLEGKTGKETARQLGCPEGTVSSRLARGRLMLAKGLTRHGLALSGGALAVMLSQNVVSASVPASLVSSTIKAASLFAAGQAAATGVISAKVAALTEGVLKAMLLTNLKFPLVLLIVIGLAGAGIGNMSYVGAAKDQPVQGGQQQPAQEDVKQDEKPLQDNPILSSDEFLGKWAGEKNGIKVELTFTGKQAAWGKNAVGKLEYRVARKPKIPQQSPTVLITKGVDLKCVPDLKTGRLNLHLPKYLGDDKAIKKIPAFNGRAPVGEITRGAKGTIQLRIIPTGYEKYGPEEEYPAVEGLILRRVAEASKEGKKSPDEKKPPDQSKQILDMVLKGFQAYQDSKGGRDQDQNLVKKDMEKLQGTWRVVSSQVGDEKAAEDEVKKRKVTVKGDRLIYEYGNEQKEKQEGTIKLDPKTKAFDWIISSPEKATMLAIYDLTGDDLKIGFGNDGVVRPRQFVMGKEDVVWLLVLKRDNPQKDVPKKEADPSAEQERTIAAIKELGGHVLIDRGTISTSTVKVILSETDVKDKDLGQLKGLPTLQELYLFRTKVTGEGLKHLKALPRLQRLDLSHCAELTEAGLANLKGLTKLQTLDVTATGIRDADLKYIKNLTDLQTLYLRFNPKITDIGLEELKGLTKLQTLVLDKTEITDAGLKHLIGLNKLRTLHLANGQLTDATLGQLKGFTDLRSLSLIGTKATDAGLVNLKGLIDLEELYLDGTQLTDAGLDNLKRLTKLRTLSLRLTKTTDRGVESLKQSLPKVNVIR